jgi:hypothetical protein
VSLGDHLGSNQDIGVTRPESPQNPLETPLPLDRVPIQTSYGCFGKESLQNFLNLLSAVTEEVNILLAAGSTSFGDRLQIPTIVAKQAVGILVISEAEAAVLTDFRVATASTQQGRRVSSPIQQDQDLLLAIQLFGDGFLEVLGQDDRFTSLLKLDPHIDHMNGWKRTLQNP